MILYRAKLTIGFSIRLYAFPKLRGINTLGTPEILLGTLYNILEIPPESYNKEILVAVYGRAFALIYRMSILLDTESKLL